MDNRNDTDNIKCINDNSPDTVNQTQVDHACKQLDEILTLPEKRMQQYYEEHFSGLNPIIQGLLVYMLNPYGIDKSGMTVSNDDAHRIMSYYDYSPVISRKPKLKNIFNGYEFRYYKKKYLNEHLTPLQREIALKYESGSERIKKQIEAEKIAIEEYKKKFIKEQEILMDQHEAFTLQCSPKTQAVIRYEDCRRIPTEGRSGFHWLSTSYQVPFSPCGWASFKASWGGTEYGVAFRIGKDCFNERDVILYYMDSDFFCCLSENSIKWLQEMCDNIMRYSSGLTDVQICETEVTEPFRFRRRKHSPTRVTTIQFRLDSTKIKDTVEINNEKIPTSELGDYVFVLPRSGEFYIELGEVLNGERVPLHYDDFCMK